MNSVTGSWFKALSSPAVCPETREDEEVASLFSRGEKRESKGTEHSSDKKIRMSSSTEVPFAFSDEFFNFAVGSAKKRSRPSGNA